MLKSPLLLLLLVAAASAQSVLTVFNLRAKGLPQDNLGISDGYVKVFCQDDPMGQTSVRQNSADPWWKEVFKYYTALENSTLKLEVHDEDVLFDDLVGTCEIIVKSGSHQGECKLEKGGTLYYEYTLV